MRTPRVVGVADAAAHLEAGSGSLPGAKSALGDDARAPHARPRTR
jgi:hypothetical protein